MKKFLAIILTFVLICVSGGIMPVAAAKEYNYSNAITSNFKKEVTPYYGIDTGYQGGYFGDFQMCGKYYTDGLYFTSYNNRGTQVETNLQNVYAFPPFYCFRVIQVRSS